MNKFSFIYFFKRILNSQIIKIIINFWFEIVTENYQLFIYSIKYSINLIFLNI